MTSEHAVYLHSEQRTDSGIVGPHNYNFSLFKAVSLCQILLSYWSCPPPSALHAALRQSQLCFEAPQPVFGPALVAAVRSQRLIMGAVKMQGDCVAAELVPST